MLYIFTIIFFYIHFCPWDIYRKPRFPGVSNLKHLIPFFYTAILIKMFYYLFIGIFSTRHLSSCSLVHFHMVAPAAAIEYYFVNPSFFRIYLLQYETVTL